MGLQPTHGNENLFLPLPLVIPSGAGPRRGTAQSRDLHFPRLSCLSHVVRMFFNRAKARVRSSFGLTWGITALGVGSGLDWVYATLSAAVSPELSATPVSVQLRDANLGHQAEEERSWLLYLRFGCRSSWRP